LVASWIRESEHGALVEIRALPGARKSEIVGEQNGRLKIRLNAPPVEGKANKELHTGDRSRDKIVLLADVTVAEAQRILKVPRGE
jgi:uncharacterized protein YggU (UPF0235/DUF167 family)